MFVFWWKKTRILHPECLLLRSNGINFKSYALHLKSDFAQVQELFTYTFNSMQLFKNVSPSPNLFTFSFFLLISIHQEPVQTSKLLLFNIKQRPPWTFAMVGRDGFVLSSPSVDVHMEYRHRHKASPKFETRNNVDIALMTSFTLLYFFLTNSIPFTLLLFSPGQQNLKTIFIINHCP